MRWKLVVLALLVPAVATSCRIPREPPATLLLTGSSTVAPLAAEIARQFEVDHPGVRVDVQTGGSGKGIQDARAGVADIGMASRDLLDDESDLTAHPIAADGVGIVVHRSNPIRELTRQQMIDIYTGKITNWHDVGGPGREIIVVHKAEGRATLEVFLKHFELANSQVKAAVIVGDNEQGIKTVAGAGGAIGYVSIGTAEADIQQGVSIKLLPLNGVAATTAHVADGSYPMKRTLNLVTGLKSSALAKGFIEFAQSPAVDDIIEAQHFVPLVH